MTNEELIEKLLLGILQEVGKARYWFVNYKSHPEETTDHMTITIEINKPDDNDRQDRRVGTLGIDPVLIRRCQNAQAD